MASASAAQLPIRFEDGPPAARRARVRASYEGGAHTPRTSDWYAPTTGANSVLFDYRTLRDRSRRAVRTDGFAKGSIDTLVYNIVGYGIKPLSLAKDEAIRKAVTNLWNRWVGVSTSDGRLGFYGQQLQAVRCWLEAGDAFQILHPRRPEDGLPVPLQIQNIEPELCPHDYTTTAPNGNQVLAGIELDRLERRTAYYFYTHRPGDFMDWNAGDIRRVPVWAASFNGDRVLHLYDPLRAGQVRGVPHLTQALVRLHELDKYDDATLLRIQLANLFAGFIKKAANVDPETNSLTGAAPIATTTDGRPVVSMNPGTMHELSDGEDVTFSRPPDPPMTYPAFMAQQLRSACAAVGVPYEVLTNDWGAINDRMARVILHEFRRRVQVFQYSIVAHQVCQPVWSAWLQLAVSSGALPITMAQFQADPERYGAVKWVAQAWPYIHPVQDVKATSDAIRAGFTSRSAAVSEQGEDAEQIDAEQAADNERADKLGLKYESDGRTAGKGVAPANAADPGADPGADPNNPDPNPPDSGDAAEDGEEQRQGKKPAAGV